MGLFFYALVEENALAERVVNSKEISLVELDPLSRINKGLVEKICQSPRSLVLCDGLKGRIDILEEKKIKTMMVWPSDGKNGSLSGQRRRANSLFSYSDR
jgi:hypothetical protein